jgi:sirohydrochlorin ferrochelatase
VVRTLGAGSGLVAATADTTSVPTWMITGTDPAGVLAAARALTPQALRDHFALAVQGTSRVPVPIQASP